MVYAYVSIHTVDIHTHMQALSPSLSVSQMRSHLTSRAFAWLRFTTEMMKYWFLFCDCNIFLMVNAVAFVACGCLYAFQFQFISFPPCSRYLPLCVRSYDVAISLCLCCYWCRRCCCWCFCCYCAACIVNTFAFTTVVDIFRLYIFPLLHLITIFAPLDD